MNDDSEGRSSGDQWRQISIGDERSRLGSAVRRHPIYPDLSVKAGWERVAHEWLALDQVELFAQRYGKPVSAEAIPHQSQIVQQQQQVQPKR